MNPSSGDPEGASEDTSTATRPLVMTSHQHFDPYQLTVPEGLKDVQMACLSVYLHVSLSACLSACLSFCLSVEIQDYKAKG